MNDPGIKIVIAASTGGSVMSALMSVPFFRECLHSVVSDRNCAAIERARLHGVPTQVMPHEDNERFSDSLLWYLQEYRVDYVVLFFTRLLAGRLLRVYRNRIINLHPSLLPAFKGLDGFGDTIRYRTRYIGTTVHFIDEHMDAGKIILQTVLPYDPMRTVAELRHMVFQQQCKSLLQVVKWLTEDRIKVDESGVSVVDAIFRDLEFVPNLDCSEAAMLQV